MLNGSINETDAIIVAQHRFFAKDVIYRVRRAHWSKSNGSRSIILLHMANMALKIDGVVATIDRKIRRPGDI